MFFFSDVLIFFTDLQNTSGIENGGEKI